MVVIKELLLDSDLGGKGTGLVVGVTLMKEYSGLGYLQDFNKGENSSLSFTSY